MTAQMTADPACVMGRSEAGTIFVSSRHRLRVFRRVLPTAWRSRRSRSPKSPYFSPYFYGCVPPHQHA
jgi:hypothetical protein